MSKVVSHQVYCGIQIGLVHASFPFTRLNVYKNNFNIKSLIGNYSFSAEELIKIEHKNHWVGAEYILKHCRQDYPQDIRLIFFGKKGQNFFEGLQQIGFSPKGKIEDLPLPRSPIAFNIPRIFSLLFFLFQMRLIMNMLLFCLLGSLICYSFEKSKTFQKFLLIPDRTYSEVQHWNRSALFFFLALLLTGLF